MRASRRPFPSSCTCTRKDISFRQADAEKGKVSGTPVGCACGQGVIDWCRVVSILTEGGYNGVLSVECGTPQQAIDSLAHLQHAGAAPAVVTV